MEGASEELTAQLRELVLGQEQRIIEDRRHLHAHPELSMQEFQTQKFVCEQLDELGIPYVCMADTRVVGTIMGQAEAAYDAQGAPAHRLALRADMDALPVTELTDFPYKSQNEGVMHACGHDCHVAMLLGAARVLNQMRGHLRGEIRLIFQPGEELARGSNQMIEEGVLEGVDSIFGMHIWSEVEAGKINCVAGQRMANTDWFRVDVQGKSAHGSMPHKGVDAVVVAAELIVALQVLASRESSPFEPTVVTVGEVHGGTARNVLAGSAYLQGTVRTWTQRAREEMLERIVRLCQGVASGLGAEACVSWDPGHCGLANDPLCASRAQASLRKLFGEEAFCDYEGTLAGEDFSEYLLSVPGAFAFLGTHNEALDARYPQHSCYYTVDEAVLKDGVMFTVQYALDTLS